MSKIFISIYLFLFITSIKLSYCSTDYAANDIINYMDKYLDTHASKSYYMTIDPDHILDEMDHKLLAKYQNIIFDKYNLVTLVIIARGLKNYGNGLPSFLTQFYKEFRKTFNIQELKCIVSLITVNDYRIALDSTNKIKYIFNDNVLSALKDSMKDTLNQNHYFLTIYELLKRIEKAQNQYSKKGYVTDL